MHPPIAGFRYAPALGILLLLSSIPGAWTQTTNPETVYAELKAIRTGIMHGFCVGLYGSQSLDFTNQTATKDLLVFVPWATTNHARLVVPAEPEYAYQADLIDTTGAPVPKTAAGSRTGTKFLQFGADATTKGIATKSLVANEIGHVTGTLYLFRPDDLFEIEKPGNYTLRIRFQILTSSRTGPGPGNYTNDLIRFPPLDYPLVKSR